MGVLRKQSTPNFPKNEHFLTSYKHDEWKIFLNNLFTGTLATLSVVAFFRNLFFFLTLSRRRPLSYRNQFTDLRVKGMLSPIFCIDINTNSDRK